MIKSEYNELMAKIADGGKVSQSSFDELTEFAKAKKVKRPPADSVIDTAAVKAAATTVGDKAPKAPKAPKEKAAPKPKATCDPSLHGSKDKCDKDARSNGVCATHYSRLVYRAKPENAEKARAASKAYAGKKRAEKKAEQVADSDAA